MKSNLPIMKLINDVWFLRRDIVSDGFDDALTYISKIIPLKIHKIPTGTKCWTWTVPEKWSVKEAYIEDSKGKRALDVKDHPLHVISYSLPINKTVTKEELLKHLHSRPDKPKAIPFEFKYYQRDWGFCIQHEKVKKLTDKKYKVVIDSTFKKGNLTVGEFQIPGKSKETVVIVAHLCHPAQVNDDLAGVAVLTHVAKAMEKTKPYYTYKFLILPETIGSIAYLSQNENIIPQLKYGMFLEMLGNDNIHALQLSRQGNTKIDRIARYVLKGPSTSLRAGSKKKFREGAFRKVICNDEMVFNGPGVNVPMISLSRFPYPQYHTSDDNPSIVTEERLQESKELVLEMLRILDLDYTPKRTFMGPVFLSGYGLWVDWRQNRPLNHNIEQIMLRLEGDKSVFEIAEELDMDFNVVLEYLNKFLDKGLIIKQTP